MTRPIRALLLAFCLAAALRYCDAQDLAKKLTIDFVPGAAEIKVPERFRLAKSTYECEIDAPEDLTASMTRALVRFPSPMATPTVENNTVHTELFLPKTPKLGKRAPAVIVLHILGGDFPLARSFCHVLAERGVVALFLKMPYYGERRPQGSSKRMVAQDPRETLEGFTQAVLDIRRAADFLARRDDVDPVKIGIFGISLGGITGGLAAGVEPRFNNVCLLLAGGDFGQVAWESKEVSKARTYWTNLGKTKEEFIETLKPIDPLTYADSLRGRRMLMLNAKEDEVIPPECTKVFWKAAGEPEIVWYTGGHYSVAKHLFNAMSRVSDFFAQSKAQAATDQPIR
jgi:dienelactone hydrolase